MSDKRKKSVHSPGSFISRKIEQLIREGYPTKQAQAIAYSEARAKAKKHARKKNPHRVKLYRANPGMRVKVGEPKRYNVPRLRKELRFWGTEARNRYLLQVKRGKRWISLGGFWEKDYAEDYGRALLKRYPHHQFRVFWK